MDQNQEITPDVTGPTRACRPVAMRPTSDWPGAFRAPQEQVEIDRRVAIYASQVQAQGFITWIPRQENTD